MTKKRRLSVASEADNNDEYEIQAIIEAVWPKEHEELNDVLHFGVKWKGYPLPTYESMGRLSRAYASILKFCKKVSHPYFLRLMQISACSLKNVDFCVFHIISRAPDDDQEAIRDTFFAMATGITSTKDYTSFNPERVECALRAEVESLIDMTLFYKSAFNLRLGRKFSLRMMSSIFVFPKTRHGVMLREAKGKLFMEYCSAFPKIAESDAKFELPWPENISVPFELPLLELNFDDDIQVQLVHEAPKGTVILTLLGELVDSSVAEQAFSLVGLLAFKFFISVPTSLAEGCILDRRVSHGPLHFFAQNCAPNCEIVWRRLRDGETQRILTGPRSFGWVAEVRLKRSLPAGSSLTIDFFEGLDSIDETHMECLNQAIDCIFCHCGSSCCRGLLWSAEMPPIYISASRLS